MITTPKEGETMIKMSQLELKVRNYYAKLAQGPPEGVPSLRKSLKPGAPRPMKKKAPVKVGPGSMRPIELKPVK